MTKKAKILVLDDNKNFLKTAKHLLSDDYEVKTTFSSEQARRLVRQYRFDVAILDQKLAKNEKGIEVLGQLRKYDPELPAIICTEYPHYKDTRASFRAGVLDYIGKRESDLSERLKASIRSSIKAQSKTLEVKRERARSIKIFLAYQHDDREAVESLFDELTAGRFLPWMDSKSIIKGPWWPQIQKMIGEVDYFLPCFSSSSLIRRRSVFRDELSLGLEIQGRLFRNEVFVVPIRLAPCEIQEEFEVFQVVNLFEKNWFSKLEAMLV
ncbi:MAG TPA: response regulator [Pyrinomonadaceae bacterium]|nr:response regulator [Pyrinomonadaceae bacterium]